MGREVEVREYYWIANDYNRNQEERNQIPVPIFCIIFAPVIIAAAIKLALEMNGSGRRSGRRGRKRW